MFSFEQDDDCSLEEFPEGYMYNAEKKKLVCWEPMYFDKPFGVSVDDAVNFLTILIKDAIQFRIDKCDAFLLSVDDGSVLVDSFVDSDSIESYTALPSNGGKVSVEYYKDQNRTVLFLEDEDDLALFLKIASSHKKFLCGLGCRELFEGDGRDFKLTGSLVNNFSEFGFEVYSPFLDSRVVEYVLDMTTPESRPEILNKLVYGKKCW